MAARVVEVALALEESLRLIAAYEPPDPPAAAVRPRRVVPPGSRRRPAGTLYHRYDVADDGTILEAKIVPPTSQNLRHMEKDLWEFLPGVLDRSGRGADAAGGDGRPQLRPVHQLRDALPPPRHRAGLRGDRMVRVIGCGNPDAGDDAAGLVVVEEARALAPGGRRRRRARDPLRLLDLLEGVVAVIVVDAVRSTVGGATPGDPRSDRGGAGRVARGAPLLAVVARPRPRRDDRARGRGRARVPPIVFHGVEAGAVAAGSDLSDAVRAALPALIDAVLADVTR